MRTLKPDLYTAPESPQSVPELRGGQCRCGYVFFPMQSYGCEKCGLTGEAVTPTLLRSEGSLTASARVLMHAAKDRTPPFVVVAVRLDAGPVVRSLLDRDRAEQLPIGTRMQGLLTEVGKADDGEVIVDLRFTPRPIRLSEPAMTKTLKDLRPVYVVGAGWHRYQPLTETTFVTLGLAAARGALSDAGIEFAAVESAFVATALLPMAPGRPILRHLGASGIELVHIENASASSSAAFRKACIEVASGLIDVALVLGVDKPSPGGPRGRAERMTGINNLADDAIVPFTHFALLADQYAQRWGVNPDDVARVAVKNHGNGAKNPNAHRQQVRTLEEILGGRPVAGNFTTLQCTPVGEGAAAVIIASEDAIRRLNISGDKPVRVTGSASRSQRVYDDNSNFDANLTSETTQICLREAGLKPEQLDVVELHDAFTVEEVQYVEAMGLCAPGAAVELLKGGAWDIGGKCAVNPSGGLIAMGHPIGPTGVGQIGEIALQLRGTAGARQHKGAKVGLAHMVGVGAVCYVHTLQRD